MSDPLSHPRGSATRRAVSTILVLLPVATLWTTALLASAAPALAEDEHAHHRQMLADEASTSNPQEVVPGLKLPDTALLDQDGNEVRFYRDLVADKIVAINFVFTTCTTVCPPMGANFGKLQQLMAERAGRDFEMISVSVDPTVDTPRRLRAWGERFGRKPGWTLVTGSKLEVDRLLKALKVFTPDKTDHSPILLLGDARRDHWTRTYGLAPASRVAEMIEHLIHERGHDGQPREATR